MNIAYYLVELDGETIGCLFTTDERHEPYFMRRLSSAHDTFLAAARWSRRMTAAEEAGMAPVEAMHRWVGAPEDPETGAIPADSELGIANSRDELNAIVNPGCDIRNNSIPDELLEVRSQAGIGRYGTPEDPGSEWADLSPLTTEKTGYSFLSESPVVYLPIVLNDEVIGYVWASETNDAADYVPRAATGPVGFDAGSVWRLRLDKAHAEGLSPIQAIQRWKGKPEHPRGGGIPASAEQSSASTATFVESLGHDDEER